VNVLIKANNISKQYDMGEIKVDALKGVSFEIFEGEFIAVLGPSGSGKSTLLNILGGIDFATSGELFFKGKPIHLSKDKQLTNYRKETIGFVFQFYNLIPNLTARENIALGAELSNNPLNIDELLEKIDLKNRADNFPSKLSGGQQQRVAIARAVAKNPDLLLCDEPTGALDYSTGIQVLRILKDFNRAYKKTVMVITHNSGIADMADRTFYVKDGEINRIDENANPAEPEQINW